MPTSVSAPGVGGKLRQRTPLVWAAETGEQAGYAIDAAREGRAREYGIAVDGLHRLVGLPRLGVAS